MTGFADYQRQHLRRERDALASRPPAANGMYAHGFRAADDATPAELGETVLEALTIINLHIETRPARESDMFDDEACAAFEAFWRPKLPTPLLAGFAPGAQGAYQLHAWMTGFSLEERYWFYAGHEIKGDTLLIGVDMSEDAGAYTLDDLVERCGGQQAEAPPPKAPHWLRSLIRPLRRGA